MQETKTYPDEQPFPDHLIKNQEQLQNNLSKTHQGRSSPSELPLP